MKRFLVFILVCVVLITSSVNTTSACDENQINTYIAQILFGDNALSRSSDEKVKLLFDALYLCCEQSDGLGQDKIDSLKLNKVLGIPTLSQINLKGDSIIECSHNSWEHEFAAAQKIQDNRRKVLRNTVNKLFDFGLVNNIFGSKSGKCNSFAALIYYFHLLADYLADDPAETQVNVNGRLVTSYSGQPYVTINGNKPTFSAIQKKSIESFVLFSPLDSLGRAGVAFANIGPEIMPPTNSRQNIGMIRPSGWHLQRYSFVDGEFLFNRCHLIAHQLTGEDSEVNLITGTRYLNNVGMKAFEDKVAAYIRATGNHVLYRVTPVFKGDNKLAAGVQMEAFSVEDSGVGICFNIYCYNVQPGVDLNYVNGDNELADTTIGAEGILPFAIYNASNNNPDLLFEMNKHLEILFVDQKDSASFTTLKSEIATIANGARTIGNHGETAAQSYLALKQYEYRLFEVLKSYIPLLLQKEQFFVSAFK